MTDEALQYYTYKLNKIKEDVAYDIDELIADLTYDRREEVLKAAPPSGGTQ